MNKKPEIVDRIIKAATAEFLNKGLDAASMQNMADTAEVSKRTLYKYYPNKEELYDALIDQILIKVESLYKFEFSNFDNIELEIENIIKAKIELTLEERFLKINRIIIAELLKGNAPKPDQMQRMTKSELQFVEWLQKAQDQKKLSKKYTAEEMATQFHSILKGQIFWPVLMGIIKPKDIDHDKVIKTTLKFFKNSFF